MDTDNTRDRGHETYPKREEINTFLLIIVDKARGKGNTNTVVVRLFIGTPRIR